MSSSSSSSTLRSVAPSTSPLDTTTTLTQLHTPTPPSPSPSPSVNRDINVRDSLRYFIAGNIAGMCGVVVGQPFDTLKIRMQTQVQVHSFQTAAGVPSQAVPSTATTSLHPPPTRIVRNFPAPSYYQAPIFSIGSSSSFATYSSPGQSMSSGAAPRFASHHATGGRAGRMPRLTGVQGFVPQVSAPSSSVASTVAPVAPKVASSAAVASASSPLFSSPLACFTSTLRSSGIRGLYRGMSSPLLLVGCQKSVAFGVFGTVVQHLQKQEPLPTLMQVSIAGIAGGVANAAILTPVDQFKIAMQIQSYGGSNGVVTQPSMYSTARQLLLEQGLAHGVYGNFRATLLREIPMYSIYYTLYSYLHRNYIVDHANKSRWVKQDDLTNAPQIGILSDTQKEMLTKLGLGGLTGVGCWASCYPLDTIKSSMVTQTAQNIPLHERKNIRQMIQYIHKTGGIRAFYNGLTPALMRAFPVHAVVFFTFASVSEWLEANQF